MAGCAGSRSLGLLGLRSTSQGLCMVLLLVLVMKSLVFDGPSVLVLPTLLTVLTQSLLNHCCISLTPSPSLPCSMAGDSLSTPYPSRILEVTLIFGPGSSTDIMVSDCRRKEQMSDCSYTRTSPVFGFWIYSRCCFLDFCNDPQSRAIY
uniref:Lymphocyte antigen 6 family member G5C n=1 Tax=Loxodonta africana TaxID=9785 RepID=G3TS53_LOXAF